MHTYETKKRPLTVDAEMVLPTNGAAKIPTVFFHGKQIGQYQGHPIFDTLQDNHDVVRTFVGIFVKGMPLKPGSIITVPGLVYQIDQ